jgi:hypothetical protein
METLFLSIGCGNNASNDKLGPGYPSFQLGNWNKLLGTLLKTLADTTDGEFV